MILLLSAVAIPYLRAQRSRLPELSPEAVRGGLLQVRRTTEDEVISDFLKAEFFQPEFDPYRERFANWSLTLTSEATGSAEYGEPCCSAVEAGCGVSFPWIQSGGKLPYNPKTWHNCEFSLANNGAASHPAAFIFWT